MRNKNIVLFFELFTEEHLGKDPFLVPYYLGKELGYDVTILFPDLPSNQNLPIEINGVRLVRLPLYRGHNFRWKYLAFFRYIWKNAKSIDILMRFFDIGVNRELSIIYKLRNPQGKFYIKMDVNPINIERNADVKRLFLSKIKDIILYSFSNRFVDVISCETLIAYEKLITRNSYIYRKSGKLVVMPNGFDEKLLESFSIHENRYKEKENIMITVGRLGSPPKNSLMLLKALEKVEMKNWKFYFIGPIDDNFRSDIDLFYINNPNKVGDIVFTGPIFDKKQLWNYYNRSKVFVLTSEWESYGLVLVEAKRFRNYIITTPVGAAYDLTEDGQYGEIIPPKDSDFLARKIQDVINGLICINVYEDFDPMSVSYERAVNIISAKLL